MADVEGPELKTEKRPNVKRQWRLLLSPPLDAMTNMAIDSYLFKTHQLGDPPTLRLYTWSLPSISIGITHDLDQNLLWKHRGHAFVRRLSGGGLVVHGEDLTYSVIYDAYQSWIPYRVKESYLLFHQLVAEALSRLGLKATLSEGSRGESEGACFREPVAGDLLFKGKKIAGAAQKRGRRTILHQGSIQIGAFRKDQVDSLKRHFLETVQEKMAISFVSLDGFKQGGENAFKRHRVSIGVSGSRLLGS